MSTSPYRMPATMMMYSSAVFRGLLRRPAYVPAHVRKKLSTTSELAVGLRKGKPLEASDPRFEKKASAADRLRVVGEYSY